MRGRPGAGRFSPPWRSMTDSATAVTGGATSSVFSWGNPALPDLTDGVALVLGVKFAVAQAASCTGVEWRVPNTVPVGLCTFTLWNFDTQLRLATVDATVGAGSAGALTRFLFASPVAVASGTNYLASVFTPNRYVATANYTWPRTDGILTADAANGWLVIWPTEVFPNNESANDANYHVGPVVAA